MDLSLSLFPWAQFRRHKSAMKLHTLLDLRGNIPSVLIVTSGRIHDVHCLDQLVWEPGAIYLMDRGYLDFRRLYRIHQSGAFFVTRSKQRLDCQRHSSQPVDKATGLRCDQLITLNNPIPKRSYPEEFRRIRYIDPDTNRCFVFLSNNTLPPATHVGLRPFISTIASMRTLFGPFGPGLTRLLAKNRTRYFRLTRAR